jgi:hypothetical protein
MAEEPQQDGTSWRPQPRVLVAAALAVAVVVLIVVVELVSHRKSSAYGTADAAVRATCGATHKQMLDWGPDAPLFQGERVDWTAPDGHQHSADVIAGGNKYKVLECGSATNNSVLNCGSDPGAFVPAGAAVTPCTASTP